MGWRNACRHLFLFSILQLFLVVRFDLSEFVLKVTRVIERVFLDFDYFVYSTHPTLQSSGRNWCPKSLPLRYAPVSTSWNVSASWTGSAWRCRATTSPTWRFPIRQTLSWRTNRSTPTRKCIWSRLYCPSTGTWGKCPARTTTWRDCPLLLSGKWRAWRLPTPGRRTNWGSPKSGRCDKKITQIRNVTMLLDAVCCRALARARLFINIKSFLSTYNDSVCSSMSAPLLVNMFIRVLLLLSLGLSPRPPIILEDLWTNLRFVWDKWSSRLSCSVNSHTLVCTKK